MTRRRPVKITTPRPTVWELAKMMGVSRKRTKEIVALVDQIIKEDEESEGLTDEKPATSAATPTRKRTSPRARATTSRE